MKKIAIEDAYSKEIILFDIVPAVRVHKENARYSLLQSPKQKNTFIYFYSCCGHYITSDGECIEAVPGDLVYIPKGAKYEVIFSDTKPEQPGCIRVEFSMMEQQEEVIFSEKIENWKEYYPRYIQEKLFDMVERYQVPVKPMFVIKSTFYAILYEISVTFHRHNLANNEFATIYEGIHYIENDAEQAKSIAEIASMCHVSESYFRNAFKRYSGQSPIEYRLNRKMERAKELLQANELTVSEIAEELSFKNVYYFSRVFKKKIGMSPKKYNQKKKSDQENV